MISLKTKVNVETEVEINLETPAFYKKGEDAAIAVINEENIYEVCIGKHFSYVQNGSLSIMKHGLSLWAKEENKITEDEFMKLYNKARKQTELNITSESIFTLTPEEHEERDRQDQEDKVNDYFERELERD